MFWTFFTPSPFVYTLQLHTIEYLSSLKLQTLLTYFVPHPKIIKDPLFLMLVHFLLLFEGRLIIKHMTKPFI